MNRVIPEVEKPLEQQGRYLHPAAYGLPSERGIDFSSPKEDAARALEAVEPKVVETVRGG